MKRSSLASEDRPAHFATARSFPPSPLTQGYDGGFLVRAVFAAAGILLAALPISTCST